MHVDPNMFNHMSDYNHPSSLLTNVRRSKEVKIKLDFCIIWVYIYLKFLFQFRTLTFKPDFGLVLKL